MRFTELVRALSDSVVDALAEFDRETALAAGIEPNRVRGWARVHDAFFGRTKWTKWQRRALDKARGSGLSIDQLAYIESRLSLIDDPSTRWKTRLTLLGTRGNFDAVKRRAKKLVPDPEPTPPADAVKFGRAASGKQTMTVTADQRLIADTEHFLRDGIDTSKPAMPQMSAKFEDLLRGNLGSGSGSGPAPTTSAVPHAQPRPMVLVGLPDYVSIVRGEGDEVILGLTDGTTMTGAEFLNRFVATAENELEAAVFHPEEGAVNLYRLSRFANQKQRDLARAAMPTCSQPFCRHGADACEIHHVTPWARGGETNLANLAPLCSYHNRVNDDDPRRARRGRIEMHRGTPVWVSPRGKLVPQMHHRYGAMSTLFGTDPPPG
ncbi:HNH endonuclease signature motif containing protein [Corynebacterium urinipleomorphum]|uniref:HNH endonuclease signature motif containing protein n=1 Tax=Corynebacterium urinipleomorphum TaxID=1852380 RepID=UPI000B34D5D0|nr:HNH endonuclease signature motif containing protein [Corynebacterium urinipleomorphum]